MLCVLDLGTNLLPPLSQIKGFLGFRGGKNIGRRRRRNSVVARIQ